MNFGSSRSRLLGLTRELSAAWELTGDAWRDAKREEFEHQYLEPLWLAMDRASTAIEELEELAQRVRKDCE